MEGEGPLREKSMTQAGEKLPSDEDLRRRARHSRARERAKERLRGQRGKRLAQAFGLFRDQPPDASGDAARANHISGDPNDDQATNDRHDPTGRLVLATHDGVANETAQ